MVEKKWLGLVLVVAVAAGGRYWGWRRQWPDPVAGQRVRITERVVRPVTVRWGRRYLRLGRGGKIEAEVLAGTEVNYGDKVTIVGTVYNRLIDENKIGLKLIYSDFRRDLASNAGWWPIPGWRKELVGRVERWLPGDEGGLAAGILWGGGEGLSEKGSENFRKAGLTHIVAASGYNVSVVAGWVMAVGVKMVGRRRSIYFAIVCMILYVFLAGAEAAVVRAGIMASLTLIALSLGRKTDAVWIWLITGLGMVIVNPAYLEDVGWQLSMAATAGLLWVGKGKSENLLVADLKTTLAAQGVTLPIILHYFGGVSVIAPATNLAVLWTVPLIMQITAMASMVGMVWNELGRMVLWLAWPLLRWMTWVTDMAGSWSWSGATVNKIGWGWVVGYYLMLLIISKFGEFGKYQISRQK